MHNGVPAVAQSSRGHGGAQHTPQRPGQPQVSQALLQGAREIASILERRIANVKAEYEDKLKLITRERDELLAQKASPGIPQIVADELEALRDDRDGHEQERAQWEIERGAFLQERARYQQECEALRKSQQELQEEVMRIRHRMEEEVATRDATIAALQERVKLLEAAQNPHAHAEQQQPKVPDQTDFDTLDVFQSPRQSDPAGPPQLSSSTLDTISPSQDSVPMQVDVPPPAASSPHQSPPLTLGGGQSPPKSPTITVPGGQSPSIARSPTMVSQSGAPTSSSSGSATRLVIRVPPPPTKNARKPIKPPISPPTEEEQRIFVHVPRQKNSSDEASSESSSGSSSTSSSATHSP
ncbi:hypothetical protein PYCCODRAFT_1462379 [Trametes coccinea BRFM310]|uniref:Uncharacterized protein n=1 Tax=Trametes coccinea (strain BRFM310) TaxID=1353009 RepID=A0A1Y2I641_TRAC3|nr:hypothetical protein PYCCODRAFT_1462379 [Trametes coccinea BRFM310]